jgi:hypothetical protein
MGLALMDFKTFTKSIDLVKSWRAEENKPPHEWPDPRDPVFQKYLEESGVVAQDLDKSLVALCAWREGRSELYPGMSAVLHVLVNRQKKFPPRQYLEDQQFLIGKENNPRQDDYPEDEINFVRLLENLDTVLADRTFDLTNGATNFGDTADEFPAPEYTKTSSVGSLLFFKKEK